MKRPLQSALDKARLNQAVSWNVRLESGDAGEDDWREFTVWLEADADNRLAYDRLEELNQRIESGRDAIRDGLHRLETRDTGVVVEFRRWASRLTAIPRGRAVASLLAASLLVAIGIAQVWRANPASRVYATHIGENKVIELADGSTIHLNTNSRIKVALAENERHVTLDRGEALFRVARDPSRPFIVLAGDRKIQVVGTVFNVLRDQGRLAVTVARGIVAVQAVASSPEGPEKAPARLLAGQQLIHREGSGQTLIREIDPQVVLAWQKGTLTYEDALLSEVLADLNRYFAVPVRPHNAAVASLRFSGVLKVDNEAAVLRRLEEFLPVTAERTRNDIVLRPRSEAK